MDYSSPIAGKRLDTIWNHELPPVFCQADGTPYFGMSLEHSIQPVRSQNAAPQASPANCALYGWACSQLDHLDLSTPQMMTTGNEVNPLCQQCDTATAGNQEAGAQNVAGLFDDLSFLDDFDAPTVDDPLTNISLSTPQPVMFPSEAPDNCWFDCAKTPAPPPMVQLSPTATEQSSSSSTPGRVSAVASDASDGDMLWVFRLGELSSQGKESGIQCSPMQESPLSIDKEVNSRTPRSARPKNKPVQGGGRDSSMAARRKRTYTIEQDQMLMAQPLYKCLTTFDEKRETWHLVGDTASACGIPDFELLEVVEMFNKLDTFERNKPVTKRGLWNRVVALARNEIQSKNNNDRVGRKANDLTPEERGELGILMLQQRMACMSAGEGDSGKKTPANKVAPWTEYARLAPKGSPLSFPRKIQNSTIAARKRLVNAFVKSGAIGQESRGSRKPLIFNAGVMLDLALILDPEQFKCLTSAILAKVGEGSKTKLGDALPSPSAIKDLVEQFFMNQYLRELVDITKHCPEQSHQLREMARSVQACLGSTMAGTACQILLSETQQN